MQAVTAKSSGWVWQTHSDHGECVSTQEVGGSKYMDRLRGLRGPGSRNNIVEDSLESSCTCETKATITGL